MPRRCALLIGNYAPPFGGVSTHLKYLAEGLADRGWEVVIMPEIGPPDQVERPEARVTVYRPPGRKRRWLSLANPSVRLPNLRTWRSAYPKGHSRTLVSSLAWYKWAKQIAIRHQVSVISAYHILNGGELGAWLTEDLGIPLVTTIFGEIYSNPEAHRPHLPHVRHVVDRTSKWLSCSRHCADSVKLVGLNVDVEPLLYGIDINHFHPRHDSSAVRARLGLAQADRIVLFVGRMKEEMGLGVLLRAITEALMQCPNVTFVIVGRPGELTAEAERVAGSHPGRVQIRKNVPDSQLPEYYCAADLVTAPSTNSRACLGLAIAEAFACGKPVIGCRVGGTAEVLLEGETGWLVPPNDHLALAAAIVDAVQKPAELSARGEAARRRAVNAFDKDKTNARMEEILTALVAQSAMG
jgi:glycosyltransferase involved in cell wall biosynthesis